MILVLLNLLENSIKFTVNRQDVSCLMTLIVMICTGNLLNERGMSLSLSLSALHGHLQNGFLVFFVDVNLHK